MSTQHYDELSAAPAEVEHLCLPTLTEVFAKTKRLVTLLDGCVVERAETADDLGAVAWIWQSLEDIEATIIGLVQANTERPLSASSNRGAERRGLPRVR
jgi:hypothetical protein